MSDYQPVQQKSFFKGVNANVDRYNQTPGSVPRLSNLLMTKRGSFVTCDGSQIVNAFNGIPTANRGRALCEFMFAPVGIARYYLRIMKGLDQHLGSPRNLTISVAGSGGILPTGTYYYVVTAVDGVGGETLASNEVSQAVTLGQNVTLTWNVVPNAIGYNIYRALVAGTEGLLIGLNVPVSQVTPGTLSVTFIDTGIDSSGISYTIVSSSIRTLTINAGIYTYTALFNASGPTTSLTVGTTFNYLSIFSPAWNGLWTVTINSGYTSFFATITSVGPIAGLAVGNLDSGGTATTAKVPPLADTTQQSVLYRMPQASGGISYSNSNIVALFPADPLSPDGGARGGSGGGGTIGGGTIGQQGSTPSGGIPGNISFIPQMVQFANQVCIALGNGFYPQIYRDALGTLTNPAFTQPISAISVDAFGVVTVTTSVAHGLVAAQVGANVTLANILNPLYNQAAAVTIAIPSTTTFKVVNLAAIGQAASSGGTYTSTTSPFISTFTSAYPVWATGVTYLTGDIVVPTVTNGHYYTCIQAGTSAATQPTWPTVTGATVVEITPSSVIWKESGLVNSTAPPPPGCAHLTVFAGSLWVWDTSPFNTANGLDGPCSLRMSDVNNPNSWNPVNQAFLDKDDGTEGMGIAAFTITGFGIPPEGSLVAFKLFAGYQIVGVFGAPDFLIQRIKSDMGCSAPRSIQFTTGFGLTRFAHLGFAVFDGVNDRIIDEDVHPYIFPENDIDNSDITTVDFNWMPISWATQTAHPAMYVCAMPIGSSGGKLTRIFCYDLVLKAWAVVDLPFAISTLYQARPITSVAITLMGTYDDGALHRWQSGDDEWDNSIDTPGPSPVNWSVETPMVYNQKSQTGRIYAHQLIVRGRLTDLTATLAVQLKLQGEGATLAQTTLYTSPNIQDGLFTAHTGIKEKVINLDGIISGSGAIELNSFTWQIKPEVDTVPMRLT